MILVEHIYGSLKQTPRQPFNIFRLRHWECQAPLIQNERSISQGRLQALGRAGPETRLRNSAMWNQADDCETKRCWYWLKLHPSPASGVPLRVSRRRESMALHDVDAVRWSCLNFVNITAVDCNELMWADFHGWLEHGEEIWISIQRTPPRFNSDRSRYCTSQ